MPITAKELIEGRQPPATVREADLVPVALRIMLEYDYSQLPIVGDGALPRGLITTDSILKAMDNFGVSAEKLRVRDAATKHIAFTPEVNVFDLLESLGSSPSVLIVDETNHLIGIITNYDMALHFRERTEDLMFVEDIETALKEHIRASFSHLPHDISERELQDAIDKVANAPIVSTVDLAIRRYSASAMGKDNLQVDSLKQVRESFFKGGRSLDDMTLNQLIDLMLYPSQWKDYQKHFTLDDKAFRNLLGEILDIRNTLAHFRDDLTSSQRSKLQFCASWFERNPPVFRESSSLESVGPSNHLLRDVNTVTSTSETEGVADAVSRYARLADYLQGQSTDRIRLTLDEIEAIIGGQLPPSARRHRSWWANDWTSQSQSKQWLRTGWRVAGINLTTGIINFVRSGAREIRYIGVFSVILGLYKTVADFAVKSTSPGGTSWHTVGSYRSDGVTVATLNFSFAKSHRFRVELYIDAGFAEVNKGILDALQAEQKRIEEEIRSNMEVLVSGSGQTDPRELVEAGRFSWERLDERRASRIAFTISGNITDSEQKLSELAVWAAYAMVALQHVLTPRMADLGYVYSDR